MKEKTDYKFKEKFEVSYEKYFHTRYDGMTQITNEMVHVLGKDKAYEIIKKVSEEIAVESAKRFTTKKGEIKDFEDFKVKLKEGLKSPFWSHVLTLTYLEETHKKLSLCVTECLWVRTFKEMAAPDIGYIMCCHPDYAMAKAYHPQIRLKRTKTLMQGDECCNHIYYWSE